MTQAGNLKQGDIVLWFDPSIGDMGPFRVGEVLALGNKRVSIRLKSSAGRRVHWAGSRTALIQRPNG